MKKNNEMCLLIFNMSFLNTLIWFLVFANCDAIESPTYAVIHTESDFEIRRYAESVWMTADVRDIISFEKATRYGFHRLFQYIQGANLNYSRIAMTKPVLTSIVPEAGPLNSSAYFISFYMPTKFQATPPLPLHELHLKPGFLVSHCIAVRKFSGFAKDSNIVKEAEKLGISLSRSSWSNSSFRSGSGYSIAQYNAPFQFTARVNEVWADLNGCESGGAAAY